MLPVSCVPVPVQCTLVAVVQIQGCSRWLDVRTMIHLRKANLLYLSQSSLVLTATMLRFRTTIFRKRIFYSMYIHE